MITTTDISALAAPRDLKPDDVTDRERCVLIVSPHFPPSTLAGVHRARHLAKHLPRHGWRPIVIHAHPRHYPETPDRGLAELVPATVEQVETGAIPARLARVFGVGDIGLRAFYAIRKAIEASVVRYAPEVVLITGSPFYPMLLANWIRKRWGIPVVLDFQDPWVSDDGARRAFWSKGRMAHRLAVFLEPKAVQGSAWVTSVSGVQNSAMADRYPWLKRQHMSAIPIGGDPDDFVALRAAPPRTPSFSLEPDRINLCYVGTFLPHAGPVVRTLFEAVARLQETQRELASRLRLVFVGTSNQPVGVPSLLHHVLPIAKEAGIAEVVREHPARIPFLEALSILANAHGLLLLGSDEAHYTASKIYPALMSGRPFLSIFHSQSSSHRILSAAGGGAAFAFSDPTRISELVLPVQRSLERLMRDPESFGPCDPAAYSPYTACAVTGQFAEVFKIVSR